MQYGNRYIGHVISFVAALVVGGCARPPRLWDHASWRVRDNRHAVWESLHRPCHFVRRCAGRGRLRPTASSMGSRLVACEGQPSCSMGIATSAMSFRSSLRWSWEAAPDRLVYGITPRGV